jgi:tetratricopeptide (TPR) repeat protein
MDPRLILGKLALAASIVAQATITQAAEPRAVPKALVPVLNAAERALKNGETKSAIKLLQSYQGDEDALLALMLGHSHQALKQFTQAENHYRNALKLDVSLKPAKLGLAQVLVDQSKWKAASDILGEVVKVDHGSASELGLYARVAFELRDLRLASLLVERAIIRFPSDLSFRRLDLALLMERNESKKAFEAARALLAKHPNDAQIWKQLAAITEGGEHIHTHLAS